MPRTVLVVDDSAAFRTTARMLLEARGYEVVGVAEDVASGLAAARELQPDCVLLDVNLPDGDGDQRGSGRWTARAAVVLVSTLDASALGDVERSARAGSCPRPSWPRRGWSSCWGRHERPRRDRRGPGAAAPGDRAAARRRRLRGRRRGRRRARPAAQGRRAQARRRDRRRPDAARQHRRRPARGARDPRDAAGRRRARALAVRRGALRGRPDRRQRRGRRLPAQGPRGRLRAASPTPSGASPPAARRSTRRSSRTCSAAAAATIRSTS